MKSSEVITIESREEAIEVNRYILNTLFHTPSMQDKLPNHIMLRLVALKVYENKKGDWINGSK